jgi:hypothetical protein
MVSACVLFAATSVFADDVVPALNQITAPADQQMAVPADQPPVVQLGLEASAPASVAPTQLASVEVVPPAAAPAVKDPLHADPRWPLFANCINNTATPDDFNACLQMAFTGVGPTDKVLALLTR